MPELIEVEGYRRQARAALGRRIAGVDAPDLWFLKGGVGPDAVREALVGRRFERDRRIGKLLLLDTDGGGPTLGLRFGMTGRLLIDGDSTIDKLEYASGRAESAWDRFTVRFDDGGELRINDARRLGAVELDPDETRLGVDATTITLAQLGAVLGASAAPLKARLMDQARIAGLGNLLTDETLWRAGLDPARPAGSLSPAERRRLHRHLRRTLDELTARGGSHTGELQVARARGASCPKDGAPLLRRTIGGRTTYSCPRHQT
ncbi:MAG: formamidopyrimidine-DNA glycosylase [Acidimicrobiaceae bacterium]